MTMASFFDGSDTQLHRNIHADYMHEISLHRERSELLSEISQNKCLELIPAHVYVSVLMILGLFGNVLVCTFYSQPDRVSPTTRFLVALATIDTIVCLLMPKNVAIMCLSYRGYDTILCKVNVYFNHVAAISSGLILTVVAFIRSQLVRNLFVSPVSLSQTNKVIVLCVFVAMVVAIPVCFTYETAASVVRIDSNHTDMGYNCRLSKDPSKKTFIFIVSATLFAIFLAAFMIFVVLYGKMCKNIFKYYKNRKNNHNTCMGPEGSSGDSVRFKSKDSVELAKECIYDAFSKFSVKTTTIKEETTNDFVSKTGEDISNRNTRDKVVSDSKTGQLPKTSQRSNTKPDTNGARIPGEVHKAHTMDTPGEAHLMNTHGEAQPADDRNTSTSDYGVQMPRVVIRQVLMCFSVTAVFFVSFMPYLAISIHGQILEPDTGDLYTNWKQVCLRSYLINSALNPVVYGFFNPAFRNFVKRSLCQCYKRK